MQKPGRERVDQMNFPPRASRQDRDASPPPATGWKRWASDWLDEYGMFGGKVFVVLNAVAVLILIKWLWPAATELTSAMVVGLGAGLLSVIELHWIQRALGTRRRLFTIDTWFDRFVWAAIALLILLAIYISVGEQQHAATEAPRALERQQEREERARMANDPGVQRAMKLMQEMAARRAATQAGTGPATKE